ncbi:Ubiquitin carboxyl-terminal hydrolase 19, partial [Apiospora arundinis]
MGLCLMCNKADASLCRQCNSAFYCSKKCQTADFPIHKLLCSDFKTFNATSRPSGEHFRAIIFPVVERKPNFIWLHCKSDSEGYQCPDIEALLGPNAPLSQKPIRYNPILDKPQDTALVDGSKPNESVRSILNTKAGRYFDWCGQLGAYNTVGLSLDPERCQDLDMNDLRHIADYLISLDHYRNPPTALSGMSTDSEKAIFTTDPSVVDRPHSANVNHRNRASIMGFLLLFLF